jgi:hypothetical protein
MIHFPPLSVCYLLLCLIYFLFLGAEGDGTKNKDGGRCMELITKLIFCLFSLSLSFERSSSSLHSYSNSFLYCPSTSKKKERTMVLAPFASWSVFFVLVFYLSLSGFFFSLSLCLIVLSCVLYVIYFSFYS